MNYETLDISGDAGIRASGGSLREAFEAAATGMYSLITDPDGVQEYRTIEVAARGESLEGLLVSFLNELVFHFDAYGFIGKRVEIKQMEMENTGRGSLKANVHGEQFDPVRHSRGLLIKAATYHGLAVEKKDGLWSLDVIFDI